MKKVYLLIVVFLGSFMLNAQTYLNEDFSSGQMPPGDWTIDGYASQWEAADSKSAGGAAAPEAKFTYTNGIGVSRLVSPQIDLSGLTEITLRFAHYFDNYSGSDPKIGVATRSGRGDWTSVWELAPSGDVGPEVEMIVINSADVGAADFQFCLYIDGNFYNMDYWYIDDISLYNPLNLDAEMTAITTPGFTSGAVEVEGLISNWSQTTFTSVEINWQVNDGDINTSNITGINVPTGSTYNFVCDQLFDFPIGTYDLNVWISKVNGSVDDDETNNSLSKSVSVVSFQDSRKPLFEEFTSSTCSPCASFNSSFVPWCETNADDITLVKYQMSWPGAGDPYYTEEGGERRGYYGVTWVPWLVGDGQFLNTDMGTVNSFFTQSQANPSFVSTVGTHTMNGNTIDVTANVLPYANFANSRVYIVVFENITTQNVGTNGETEFEHVMMKMLPDASGSTFDFVDREPVSITQSFDLSSTNVEEFDDLGVAIIVQDYSTKEVFQSAYSVEGATYNTESRLSDVTQDGTSLDGFDSDIVEYNIELPEGTVDVPVLDGIPIEDAEKVVVVPATELPGSSIIDVYGEDLISHTRYTFNYTVSVGVGENYASNVKIYPNPSNGIVYIKGVDEQSTLSIFNIAGKKVTEYEGVINKIDLSELNNGIYFVRIKNAEGIVSKRITINK